MSKTEPACEEQSVANLYKDTKVAELYVEQRFAVAWSRLLHQLQVAAINKVIRDHGPELVVELAPGPARLTTEIEGVRQGVLVEYSEEMLAQARERLKRARKTGMWDIRHGNAFELANQNLESDFLYTFRFIRHFHTEDRNRIYSNIRHCLRPDGLLMFDVVNRVVREALDAAQPAKPKGELDVYDVTYTPTEFGAEMASNGFEVVSLKPVIRRFGLQSWLSYSLQPRIGTIVEKLVRALDWLPSREPLEWIALCRRTK